jgi:predicted RNA-binding protein with PUA-like domain
MRTLQIGDSLILYHSEYDSNGVALSGRTAVWLSSAPSVVSVVSDTRRLGLDGGRARLGRGERDRN